MTVVHLVATLFMVGVIVFVQVVHYPLMERVGGDAFVNYQAGHVVRTGVVVVPPMIAEVGSAVWLFAGMARGSSEWMVALLGLVLLAVIWLSTAFLQAPAHGRLESGFNPSVHRALVRWNWLRTAAWLGRVPVAVMLLN
ncbi:MAG: hypothetical protein AAF389_20720 [Gemmatimonadota bacterium]